MSRFPRRRFGGRTGSSAGNSTHEYTAPGRGLSTELPEKSPISALQTRPSPIRRNHDRAWDQNETTARKLHGCQDLNRIGPMRLVLAIALFSLWATSAAAQPAVLAPYSPTPRDVVDRMLAFAGVGPSDVV